MSDSGESGFLPTLPRTPAQPQAPSGATFDSLKGDRRLECGDQIGKGGMGVVFSATDVRLKRPMAMKQATSTSAADLERFVREARVQGQLQHPGIVPVHELGISPDTGLPYFTMKRVRGVTLSEVIDALASGNPEARAKHTRQRLLNAFQSVCQAVEYAHSQGVLHRDLKPANVMLGDFGEVYVLDWGLAKPTGQVEVETSGPALTDDLSVGATPTVAGSLMGTPGYMSPELVVGQPATVQSDVFALGSMLFELLALERLVPGDTVVEILTATRDGYEPSVRKRRPEFEVPPELDAVVQKACARDSKARYPSVRALHEALERVLAGERDLELRAEMAKVHAARAAAELPGSLRDGSIDGGARNRALQEAGRALALDPKNAVALSTLLQLMEVKPTEMPAEVKASIDESSVLANRAAAFFGSVALMLLVLFLPWILAMGSTNWVALGALLGVMTAAAGASFGISRMRRPSSALLMVCATGFMLSGAIINLVWLPLLVATPMLLVATTMYVSLLPRKLAKLTVALAVAALISPYLAWWAGAIDAPFQLKDGALVVNPGLLQLDDFWTHVLIIDAVASTAVFGAFASWRIRITLDHAQEKLAFLAWNLRLLLPEKAREALTFENTVADPKCAIGDFYQGVTMGRRVRLASAQVTAR